MTDVTDAKLGASGLWLGTRTGAGGTATVTKSFSGRSPWLHGQQVARIGGTPAGKEPLGRPRLTCEDNIRMGLKEIGINMRSWIDSSQELL